jgi:hypothetical protein
MPAVVEADDDGLYVLKFRGAGQGAKALIAEIIGGELARAMGLPIPELTLLDLDPDMARTEPDPEIQHLIRASAGLNLAVDYLPGSITFDPLVDQPDAALASAIVWLDAFISNVDRTARNANMLMWHQKLWLIDHGASLFFHHPLLHPEYITRSASPFPQIKDHVLLPLATKLPETDTRLSAWLIRDMIDEILEAIPDSWLSEDEKPAIPSERRAAYAEYLVRRLQEPRVFMETAIRAHQEIAGR